MDPTTYTSINDIERSHAVIEAGFRSGKTRPVAFRKKQLAQLAYMLKDNMDAINTALQKDLHRNSMETIISDTGLVIGEAVYAYTHVDAWAKDIKPSTSFAYQAMNLRIKPSPKGAILIISPFNYPMLLTFVPLVGALAAGCTALLKLPESLRTTSSLLGELVAKYLDPEVVQVVQGAVKETSKLLELKWDHIFFTGSERVGRIVATAAAKHTTPTTLELGGKCPVIVDPRGADLAIVAKRILWGRTNNAGQTCVAPDYVLIPRSSQDAFIAELEKAYKGLFPTPTLTSDSYGRLVNEGAVNRIKGYLDNTKGNIIVGGKVDAQTCYVEPTIVANVGGEDSTMQDEIFGPLLSVVPVDTLDNAIDFISERPQPLALYVFSQNSHFKNKVTANTRSGSIVFNDVLTQVGAPGLPFGGSGSSGHGYYKGKFGFDTFTHMRSSMDTPNWVERFMLFRYPPYTKGKLSTAVKTTGVSLPFDRQGQKSFKSKITPWLAASLISALIAIAYHRNHQGRASQILS